MAHARAPRASMAISPDDLVDRPTIEPALSRREKLPALGIDFGTKFVGIALAASPLAQPLTVAANNEYLLSYICTLIDDYQIKTVVIGLSERQTAARTKAFADRLRMTISCTIEFADETLTTQVVKAKLKAAGHKLKEQQRVDHFAAAELLQDWLDARESFSL